MQDTKCNGWTNYATWRINLEIFDVTNLEDMGLDSYSDNPHGVAELGRYLEDYAQELLEIDTDTNSLAYSYALAFMSDVNWYEIGRAHV